MIVSKSGIMSNMKDCMRYRVSFTNMKFIVISTVFEAVSNAWREMKHFHRKRTFFIQEKISIVFFSRGWFDKHIWQVFSWWFRLHKSWHILENLGDTRVWTGDLSICSRMLYHWAISPCLWELESAFCIISRRKLSIWVHWYEKNHNWSGLL